MCTPSPSGWFRGLGPSLVFPPAALRRELEPQPRWRSKSGRCDKSRPAAGTQHCPPLVSIWFLRGSG